jgi:single-strand DNA-binding protein
MANLNLNKVILGGGLTSDVELKQTPQGIAVCSFSVAVNRKTKQGEDQKADFINCQAWRSTAEFISKFFKKGSSICLVGSIQTRSWNDNNGNKRYATEVIADEAYFVDSKAENDAPSFQTQPTPNFEEVSNDEDLPF